MATIRLIGTDTVTGQVVEHLVGGPLIYDEDWKLTVDPATLRAGDVARTLFGCPPIKLTLDPEEI